MVLYDSSREQRFTQWARDHAAILHKTANGFAPRVDRDDLMQELLLALWKALPGFRGDCQPSTFVYRVAHNAALTWKRARRGDERLEPLDPYVDALSAPAPARDERERVEQLYAAIRRLPPLDRSLVLLSLDGIAYDEIAALHGLTASNVGARLTRARQKLALTFERRTP